VSGKKCKCGWRGQGGCRCACYSYCLGMYGRIWGRERDEKIVICDLYCMIMYDNIWTGLGGIFSSAAKDQA
jgi:hypothetical protein